MHTIEGILRLRVLSIIRAIALNLKNLVLLRVLPVYVFLILLSSCSMFGQIGENAGEGFGRGLNVYVDSMAQNAVGGLREGIDEAEFDLLIDSLIHRLNDSLATGVALARDELFGEVAAQYAANIRDTLFGDATRAQVSLLVNDIMEELIGEQTRNELGLIRDELLGEALRTNLMGIRDELTGPETEARLAALARSFVYEVGRSYADTLRPLIREDIEYTAEETKGVLSWLRRNITSVIWIFGLVAAILIALIWFFRTRGKKARERRDKNERIIEIITREIDEMGESNPALYEQLKTQISRQTKGENVGAELDEILVKQRNSG